MKCYCCGRTRGPWKWFGPTYMCADVAACIKRVGWKGYEAEEARRG
jgi:hypothetical protein